MSDAEIRATTIKRLRMDLGLMRTALEQKTALLASCEAALEKSHEREMADPVRRVLALGGGKDSNGPWCSIHAEGNEFDTGKDLFACTWSRQGYNPTLHEILLCLNIIHGKVYGATPADAACAAMAAMEEADG